MALMQSFKVEETLSWDCVYASFIVYDLLRSHFIAAAGWIPPLHILVILLCEKFAVLLQDQREMLVTPDQFPLTELVRSSFWAFTSPTDNVVHEWIMRRW